MRGRSLLALTLALLCGACASTRTTTPGGVPIDTRHASRNQDSRVLFLVLHARRRDGGDPARAGDAA